MNNHDNIATLMYFINHLLAIIESNKNINKLNINEEQITKDELELYQTFKNNTDDVTIKSELNQ